MSGSYIYRNSDDTVRVHIQTRKNMGADNKGACREWDFDVFFRGKVDVETYSACGDVFYSKRDSKAFAENRYGRLVSIYPDTTITQGW